MNLLLLRDTYTEESTIGRLYIGDSFECYTLEDKVRDTKVFGKTAIPCGQYSIIIDFSSRFQKELPRLLDVPDFQGIRIHSGNSAKDTEGCILVGTSYKDNWLSNSKIAFNSLMEKLEAAYNRKEAISIRIQNTHG